MTGARSLNTKWMFEFEPQYNFIPQIGFIEHPSPLSWVTWLSCFEGQYTVQEELFIKFNKYMNVCNTSLHNNNF